MPVSDKIGQKVIYWKDKSHFIIKFGVSVQCIIIKLSRNNRLDLFLNDMSSASKFQLKKIFIKHSEMIF